MNDWPWWIMVGALALAGGLGGAGETALLTLSRSRLAERVDARPKVGWTLGSLMRDLPLARLNAAILHALGVSGAVVLAVAALRAGTAPTDAGAVGCMESPLLPWGSMVGLFAAVAVWRTAAALAGSQAPESFVLRLAPALWFLTLPVWPLGWLSLRARDFVARGAGHEAADPGDLVEEKVIAAVSDGALEGVVHETQRGMIEGVFDLKDADVADIFTPRTDMVAVDASVPLHEAVRLGLDNGFSRLPAYEGTRDRIVGLFVLRDALAFLEKPMDERPPLVSLLRGAVFVPETKKVADLLRDMQREHYHMAIVLDEYGGTAGLVTIEDVLEEIVGDIHDEFDLPAANLHAIEAVGENTWNADAALHVGDANAALGADWLPEDDDYETLGGFVLARLGHIPRAGEAFDWRPEDGGPAEHPNALLRVRVLEADERKVMRVEFRLVDVDD